MTMRSVCVALAVIGFGAAALLPSSSSAVSFVDFKVSAHSGFVQLVGDDRDDRRDDDSDGTHVRAPFASVDVDDGTHVEAPFTSVHTDRRGTYVRAPFVDLWIPRK